MAQAPADFGRFSGDLLVGNFGDGRITRLPRRASAGFIYLPAGQLRKAGDGPIVIDGLWALEFGNGANTGPTNTLFFTAGPNDEKDGLFGKITAAP